MFILNYCCRSRPASRTEMKGEPYTPRLKGQDLYGGTGRFSNGSDQLILTLNTISIPLYTTS